MTKHPSRNPLYDTGRYKPADEESQKWHRQFPFTLRKGVTGWRGPSKLTAGKASFGKARRCRKANMERRCFPDPVQNRNISTIPKEHRSNRLL
ncbi:hypothetical protein M404DRAFT_404127 [Pisolithus tinctorius Marx 270]|uniref:Uncharacterized protein n=1 Tax=Pisolithus tinctorius Marx 270 TaxID=870435 RepID=A0A0C3NEI8_PISTI|nr:hypothetical protein M404DRAFT_404127 [Pisolithus tinctorius Marx 270]